MERKTRKPTQKRALEKMDRVIDAAFKLFNEKGYYEVTTADIAKEAQVATGSVYAYFEDKKDIYLQVLERVNENISQPTMDFWTAPQHSIFQDSEDIKNIFKMFLKVLMDNHKFSKSFHDDMNALAILDKDVQQLVELHKTQRIERTRKVFDSLKVPFKSSEDGDIFLHYSYLIMEDASHRLLYDAEIKAPELYVEKCVELLYALYISTTKQV